ncbi:unnamed protein product [Medioppia subpectinata]|uniref:VWFA domain-containing protein n=1 Tax=Medioppia subpectinata TaxID=1979941 RepID=A0A7R9PUT6_9ACAR|nr:unnamed protein product [Medioppia subpectinata]CAG2101123.1 unnamed protein product [Medioppia subpectinata]
MSTTPNSYNNNIMKIIEISLTILSVILAVICVPKPIQYNNGEYEGLVVTIHPDITESDQLVANLKELLIKSSTFLYGATESRAQFKDIAVILPELWTQKSEYQAIPDSHWDDGHIRISPSTHTLNDKPFTFQPRGCGQSGEYIQLTDSFVEKLNQNTFDYPEKLLVNEWSHYRYGVFDEFGSAGDYRYPTFYMTNGTIYPTFCVSGIKGNAEDMNGNTCKIYSTGRVDHNCKFIADKSDNSPIASIMSLPHFQSTEKYCENNTIDPKVNHNSFAPNEHNIQCSYRSVKDVIDSHHDFTQSNTNVYTEPNITVYQIEPPKEHNQDGTFILALDMSGSMDSFWADGMQLGITAFASNSLDIHPIVPIDNDSRKNLSDTIPPQLWGGTNIPRGLRSALEMLRAHGLDGRGVTIILITDGENNEDHHEFSSLELEILNAGVRVDTIAIGYNVEQKLNDITTQSGGMIYHVNEGDDSAINTYFTDIITQQPDIEDQSVLILNREIITIGDTTVTKPVFIDQELGKNTKFVVHSDNIPDINIILISPIGEIYNDTNYKIINNKQFIELLITDSEVGEWKLEFSQSTPGWPLGNITAELSVTSEPKDRKQQPIRVNAFFGHLDVTYPSSALIYVQLMKAYNPVIDAKVVAVIGLPGDQTIELDLYDDGAGYDIRANDGVYTTAFTQFNLNDRYSVSVKITDIPSVTRLITYGTTLPVATGLSLKRQAPNMPIILPGIAPKISKSEFQINDFIATDGTEPEETIISIPLNGSFTRAAEMGAFLVDNFNLGSDGMSPGRVTDLQVIASEDNRTVELQWTAPGDDSYTATKIDLRTSLRPETLYRQELFDLNVVIDDQMLDTGSLAPPEGHTIMKVKFQIPSALLMSANTPKVTVYFGLRAVDDNTNWGEVSNIAFISVEPLPDPIPSTTTSIPPNTTTPPSSGSSCGNTSCGDKTVIETRHTVVVLQKIVRMETNLKNQTAVQIPKELGLNTTFTVTSDGITLLNVTLESPNGTVYGMTSDWAVSKPSESSAGFRIPVADAGQWSVGLEKTRSDAVVADVSVTSDERVGQSYE